MSLPQELVDKLTETADDVEAVMNDIVEDSNILEVFTTQVADNLKFFGKSLSLWEDEMFIEMPESSPSAEQLRETYINLGNKIQIASHFHELASASNAVSISSAGVKRADLITSLISHFHSVNMKVPSKDILERMADSYMHRLNNLESTSKIVKQFWKNKLETLKQINSIINSISISIAVQSKADGGDV